MFRFIFLDKYNPTNILKGEEEEEEKEEEERSNNNKKLRSRYDNWLR